MKQALLPAFIFLSFNVYSQKEDYNWLFGGINSPDSINSTSVINFNPPSFDLSLKYKFVGFLGTNASISDSIGNLICYTNGVHLFNSQDEIVEDGGDFQPAASNPLGFPASQGGLIIPFPGHQYQYIFTLCDYYSFIDNNGFPKSSCRPLTFSIIDMGLNDGAGKVLNKKIPLTYDTLHFGKFVAVQHANGRDWWVIGPPNYDSNKFHKFIVTPQGMNWHSSQKVGENINPGLGQGAISNNGAWLALYNWYGMINWNDHTEIDLYEFDRCTGMISNHIQVTDTAGLPGGVAFSPNSRYMYTSHWDKIYQWDLEAPDIVASRTVVAEYDGFLGDYGLPTRFYNMKLGPDGKIYISVPNYPSRYLHVIDQPDSAGVACNVLQHSVLLPTFNNYSLPHHPVTRLGVMEGSPCDTIVSAVEAPPTPEQEGWSLYPNPAAGSVTLSCAAPQSGPALWLLYDALGRELRREALPARYAEKTVSLEGLAKGLYFYRVEREGEAVHAGKLIVE